LLRRTGARGSRHLLREGCRREGRRRVRLRMRVEHGWKRIRGPSVNLARRATAEAVGTALLLAAVVGSGIMAERLAGGDVAIALLANAIATGGALVAIILAFGPVSGAHLNPAVTIADAWQRGIAWRDVPACDLRIIGRDLGLRSIEARVDAVRRRGLHRGRVLVHVVDVVCKPRRHDRAIVE